MAVKIKLNEGTIKAILTNLYTPATDADSDMAATVRWVIDYVREHTEAGTWDSEDTISVVGYPYGNLSGIPAIVFDSDGAIRDLFSGNAGITYSKSTGGIAVDIETGGGLTFNNNELAIVGIIPFPTWIGLPITLYENNEYVDTDNRVYRYVGNTTTYNTQALYNAALATRLDRTNTNWHWLNNTNEWDSETTKSVVGIPYANLSGVPSISGFDSENAIEAVEQAGFTKNTFDSDSAKSVVGIPYSNLSGAPTLNTFDSENAIEAVEQAGFTKNTFDSEATIGVIDEQVFVQNNQLHIGTHTPYNFTQILLLQTGGDGITINNSNHRIAVDIASGSRLYFNGGKLDVNDQIIPQDSDWINRQITIETTNRRNADSDIRRDFDARIHAANLALQAEANTRRLQTGGHEWAPAFFAGFDYNAYDVRVNREYARLYPVDSDEATTHIASVASGAHSGGVGYIFGTDSDGNLFIIGTAGVGSPATNYYRDYTDTTHDTYPVVMRIASDSFGLTAPMRFRDSENGTYETISSTNYISLGRSYISQVDFDYQHIDIYPWSSFSTLTRPSLTNAELADRFVRFDANGNKIADTVANVEADLGIPALKDRDSDLAAEDRRLEGRINDNREYTAQVEHETALAHYREAYLNTFRYSMDRIHTVGPNDSDLVMTFPDEQKAINAYDTMSGYFTGPFNTAYQNTAQDLSVLFQGTLNNDNRDRTVSGFRWVGSEDNIHRSGSVVTIRGDGTGSFGSIDETRPYVLSVRTALLTGHTEPVSIWGTSPSEYVLFDADAFNKAEMTLLYFKDSEILFRALTAGTGITFDYNDSEIIINSTASGGGGSADSETTLEVLRNNSTLHTSASYNENLYADSDIGLATKGYADTVAIGARTTAEAYTDQQIDYLKPQAFYYYKDGSGYKGGGVRRKTGNAALVDGDREDEAVEIVLSRFSCTSLQQAYDIVRDVQEPDAATQDNKGYFDFASDGFQITVNVYDSGNLTTPVNSVTSVIDGKTLVADATPNNDETSENYIFSYEPDTVDNNGLVEETLNVVYEIIIESGTSATSAYDISRLRPINFSDLKAGRYITKGTDTSGNPGWSWEYVNGTTYWGVKRVSGSSIYIDLRQATINAATIATWQLK